MAFKFTVRRGNRKYVFSLRPVALPWLYDRMSIILELRTIKGEILEVRHYHLLHESGKIVHMDVKYRMKSPPE